MRRPGPGRGRPDCPIWLYARGLPLDKASAVGVPIFGVTAAVLAVMGAIYGLFLRPKTSSTARPVAVEAEAEPDPVTNRIVHIVIWLLFTLPFILIIIGFIHNQLESLSID